VQTLRRRLSLAAALFAASRGITGCGGAASQDTQDASSANASGNDRTEAAAFHRRRRAPTPAPAPEPVPAPALPGPAPAGVAYSTSFATTETPVLGGGAWVRRATAWKAVAARGGNAGPSDNVGAHYDDCYSHVTGFPPDQQIEATIYKGAATGGEVELLLRVTDTATTVSCYECLFNVGGGVTIVRWNGPLDSFTYIGNVIFTPPDPKDGDKIRAKIVGQSIEFYYIPRGSSSAQLMATAEDTSSSKLTAGNPGIGFFQRSPGSLDYGIKDFSAIAL